MKINSLSGILAAAVLALSLALGAAAPAFSQEIPPETLSLARKYVDLTDKQAIYESILVQTASKTSKLFSQQNPEIADKIDATIGKILETYKGQKDELFNQIARVYAVEFTQDELTKMVEFYSGPVGQKMLEKSLTINAGIRAAMQVFTNNFGTEFVAKVRADLKNQGYNI